MTTDEQMAKALADGDARAAAAVLISRSGSMSFVGAGKYARALKRAEAIASAYQAALTNSPAALRHERATDRLCLLYRKLKTEAARHRWVNKIQARREDWQRKFGRYYVVRDRVLKQFEIQNFLRHNRKHFFKKPFDIKQKPG